MEPLVEVSALELKAEVWQANVSSRLVRSCFPRCIENFHVADNLAS